jgi:hypothetical protein
MISARNAAGPQLASGKSRNTLICNLASDGETLSRWQAENLMGVNQYFCIAGESMAQAIVFGMDSQPTADGMPGSRDTG